VLRAADLLDGRPGLAVLLSVLGFSFLGPVAALVLVATMLDHEFAHRFLMRRLGYLPGPVRLIPLVGAFVRVRRPMLRSADIALIYLAGPLAGVLSAASAALVASHTLDAPLANQVYLGAAVSIALNLFNLLPIEPLDGGLISRVLPYPALVLFPSVVGLWVVHTHMAATPLGVVLLVGAVWITARKVGKWRRYVAGLRARLGDGDLQALRDLRATFEVPIWERVLVVLAYVMLIPGALGLLDVLVQAGGWLH
jgi:Zn-dependent protease